MRSGLALLLTAGLVAIGVSPAAFSTVGSVSGDEVYYVDQGALNASDDNPGTEIAPWKTISRAARVVQPGWTIVVKPGTYRETVIMGATGTSNQPITFAAVPRHGAVITGSDIVTGWRGYRDAIWQVPWTMFSFPTTPRARDAQALPNTNLFQDGRPLSWVDSVQRMREGTYSFDASQGRLYIWANESRNPNQALIEVSVRPVLWQGNPDSNYIVLRGFQFVHASNPPLSGAVTNGLATDEIGGNGWVVEDNIIEWTNATGLKLYLSSRHQIRNNVIRHNGQMGIGAAKLNASSFIGNTVTGNNWKRFSAAWASGGIKATRATNLLIQGNSVSDNLGPGIWLDYKCTQNIISSNVVTRNLLAGIMLEVASDNAVLNNIVSDTASHQWSGTGILVQLASNNKIYNNTVTSNAQYGVWVRWHRRHDADGKLFAATGNQILNNIFMAGSVTARSKSQGYYVLRIDHNAFSLQLTKGNVTDYNLYYSVRGEPILLLGGRAMSLTEWQASMSTDAHSRVGDPRFVVREDNPLMLGVGSPAIDAGTALAEVPLDFRGVTRPQGRAFDIGAFEYVR